MLFWIICATLVAAIAFALALTLIRPRGQAQPAGAQDLQVYRAQLAEVDKDLARGVLSPEEAARSRVEISRRLLDADRALQAAGRAAEAPRRGTVAAAVLVVAVLTGAFALYDRLGAAGLPDAPLAGRLAGAEARYQARPDQAAAEATAAAERKAAEARAAAAGRPVPQPDPQYLELMPRGPMIRRGWRCCRKTRWRWAITAPDGRRSGGLSRSRATGPRRRITPVWAS